MRTITFVLFYLNHAHFPLALPLGRAHYGVVGEVDERKSIQHGYSHKEIYESRDLAPFSATIAGSHKCRLE
jgi:hypothetical protein